MSDNTEGDGSALVLATGRFAGRDAFQQLVRDALQGAAQQGWSQIVLSDATFEDWPLGEAAVADALHAWAQSGRKMTVLACRYDDMVHRHARFVTWRKTWSHVVECRRCSVADPLAFPSAIWSPVWVLQRQDPLHSVGMSGVEPERRVGLREQLDGWLLKSTAGLAATTLGL